MFCGKCGTKLEDNAKFCGKCGAKVDSKIKNNNNATNVNSLDSFIGNIVKKTEDQSKDQDIFSQLEQNKEPTKKVKTKAIKVKSKPKKKKISKSKPKMAKKKAPKKEKKPINLKIIIPIIAAVLILIIGSASFIFIRYGDDIFANKYVTSSIHKTLKQYDKRVQSLDQIPNLVLRDSSKEKLSQRETYLKLQNSKGGLINEDVLGSLKGLSAKIIEKHDSEKGIYKTKLSFANVKNEEMYGELNCSPTVATFSVPKLYDSVLGINIQSENNEVVTSQHYDKFEDIVKIISQYEQIILLGKNALEDKAVKLATSIIEASEFKIESKDSDTNTRIYTTTIDNASMLESFKICLTEVKDDEYIKELLSYLMYFISDKSLEVTESSLVSNIEGLIKNIDDSIKNNRVADIELNLTINKDKTIDNIVFNTVVDGIGISVNMELTDDDKNLDYTTNIKLSTDDSFLNFEIISLINETDDDIIKRENSVVFSTSLNDKITLNIVEDYSTKLNDYSCKVNFIVDSIYESLSIGYDLMGKYQLEKNLEKLNIDSMKLDVKTGLYNLFFDFKGYIENQNIEALEEVNLDNVIFIDNMSKEELEKIKVEIYKKGMEFLDLFGQGKW